MVPLIRSKNLDPLNSYKSYRIPKLIFVRNKRAALVILMTFLVSSCAVNEPGNNYVTEDHLKGNVDSEKANYFREYEESFKGPGDGTKAQNYVNRGVLLTRTVCFEYLDSLSRRANNLNFGKDQFALTTVLATGILAIADASTDAFEGIALGSAFILGTADNLRDHYLLGPDADAIIELVKKSMETVATEISQNPPTSFDIAFANLQSYSRLCTTSEIRKLVRAALKNADPTASQQKEIRQIQDQRLRDEIADLMGPPNVLTDDQFLGLYWFVAHGVQDLATQNPEITRLLGSVFDNKIRGNSDLQDQVRDKFRNMTEPTITNLKKLVKDKSDALAAPVAAGVGAAGVPVENPIPVIKGRTGNITVDIK